MILVVTSADTEILTAQRALDRVPDEFPTVRLANTARWQSRGDIESFFADTDSDPDVIVVRVLGGKQYFDEGLDLLSDLAQTQNIPLIVVPGTRELDPELTSISTASPKEIGTIFEYFSHGGVQNYEHLFRYLADRYLVGEYSYEPPEPLPWHGLYHPDLDAVEQDLDRFANQIFPTDRPIMAILFYRAHWISGNLDSIDALIEEVESAGYNPLPIFCYSMRNQREDEESNRPVVVREYLTGSPDVRKPEIIINTLSYHMGEIDREERGPKADPADREFLEELAIPVIQAMTASSTIEEWQESEAGLAPRDTAMNVAMPEFDGQIIGNAASYREPVELDAAVTGPVYKYTPIGDRIASIVQLADRHASLRHKGNHEKKIAVLLTNFPAQNDRVGNAVGLDTPASVINILRELQDAGYKTGPIPNDGDRLIQTLIDRGGYDTEFLTQEQMRNAPGRASTSEYTDWFETLPNPVRKAMTAEWEEPPGTVYRDGDHIYFAGIRFENVFVGIQPPRGFGENPIAIYHSPDLVPTHHYVGFYRWLRDGFEADAIVHTGKHGTLEWLPGKSVALSARCYPEVCNPDLPVLYPFIINDPGEGSQAKRRLHSVIIDHLVPPMTTADTYGELDRLQHLLDEYQQAEELDPKKLPQIRDEIWELIIENNLHRDLHVDEPPEDFGEFTNEIDGYLCEIGALQIRGGLHVFGEPPDGEKLTHFITSLLRLDTQRVQGIRHAIAEEYDLDYEFIQAEPGQPFPHNTLPFIDHVPDARLRTCGDVDAALESFARILVADLLDTRSPGQTCDRFSISPTGPISDVLQYVDEELVPAITRTTDEIDNLLRGLDGRYVPPGPSGAPTRGMPELLPTGRNFYSVDIRAVPSPYAWEVGKDLAESLVETHRENEGEYPESIGIVVWGTSNMRTKGDDIAEILYLLGVKPEWEEENRRIDGLSVIPLEELGRPRIDVTVRISGFFRDAFPHVIDLLDQAVKMVADLDEPLEKNYVKKHVDRDRQNHREQGLSQAEASKRAKYRIFGSKPGTYGAGILPAINERNWESTEDLAAIYLDWGGYVYTDEEYGSEATGEFRDRLSNIQVAVQNQDNREHDIFDSDDYLQFHGGMIASVRALTGDDPTAMFGDSSQPDDVDVRLLEDEARRVFRSRVVNPKWMDAMRDHGYKGALEMAATVDFLFGYDATAGVVDDWMYEDVTDAYLFDEENREFLEEKNPWAIRSMSERLLEAIERDLWQDPDADVADDLQRLYLANEGLLERRQE